MTRWLLCLIGLHRWKWSSLIDTEPMRGGFHVSQCMDCHRITGGWKGAAEWR